MPVQKAFYCREISGRLAGIAVSGSRSHVKLSLAGPEAVFKGLGIGNRKALIFFPVNHHDRHRDIRRDQGRACQVDVASVKQIHPEYDSRSKTGADSPVEPAVKTQQRFLGIGIASFKKQKLDAMGISAAARMDPAAPAEWP